MIGKIVLIWLIVAAVVAYVIRLADRNEGPHL